MLVMVVVAYSYVPSPGNVAVYYQNVGKTIPMWLVCEKYLTCRSYLATEAF